MSEMVLLGRLFDDERRRMVRLLEADASNDVLNKVNVCSIFVDSLERVEAILGFWGLQKRRNEKESIDFEIGSLTSSCLSILRSEGISVSGSGLFMEDTDVITIDRISNGLQLFNSESYEVFLLRYESGLSEFKIRKKTGYSREKLKSLLYLAHGYMGARLFFVN